MDTTGLTIRVHHRLSPKEDQQMVATALTSCGHPTQLQLNFKLNFNSTSNSIQECTQAARPADLLISDGN